MLFPHFLFQFELLVKLTISIRCMPIVQPQQNSTSEQQVAAIPTEVSDDISSSGIKFKLSLLGLTVPMESPVVPSRDFTWDAPVELISSDAWAQQMAVDEESHVAVSMAGVAAPVVLLPLRLASLMGQEKRNETNIVVDSSALGIAPVLMSSVSVTITRHTDMLSPALMDRLNPLAITIVSQRCRACFVVQPLRPATDCVCRSAAAACPAPRPPSSSSALPAFLHTSSALQVDV